MNTPSSNHPPARQGGGPGQQRDPLRRWQDRVEEELAEARERGDFDNLQGAGKPLAHDTNPFAGDKALAYSLLKTNNLAPPEIERGKEIDAELARADAMLATLRRKRDAARYRVGKMFAAERRAYNISRNNTEARYADALRAVNSKILSLNIVAPAALHRRLIDVERRLEQFRDEFPPLDV